MTKLRIYKKTYSFYKKGKAVSIHDIPSYQFINNHIEWCKNDLLHRLNGPAVIRSGGEKIWYENDVRIKTKKPKK